MKAIVVDASVAAKWFFPEEGADDAAAILHERHRLLAPELIWAELGSIVWKRQQRSLIDAVEAAALLNDYLRVPFEIYGAYPLIGAAVQLAMQTTRSVYDCLYLALAIRKNCVWVTADLRLVRSLEHSPFAPYIMPLRTDGIR